MPSCHIDGIHIFYCRMPNPSPGERRSDTERRAVASLLREAFPGHPGVKVSHHSNGAPYLSAGNTPGHLLDKTPEQFTISISHCRELAAIAISRAPGIRFGIDCESRNRAGQLKRVAPRFLTPEELPRWCYTPDLLLRAWCIKEALFKAAGDDSLTLSHIPADNPILHGHPYTIHEIPLSAPSGSGGDTTSGSYSDTSLGSDVLAILAVSSPTPCLPQNHTPL